MRKIVKENGDIRIGGVSGKNFVSYEASKFIGPVGIGGMVSFASVDENGNIKKHQLNDSHPEIRETTAELAKGAKKVKRNSIILAIIAFILVFPAMNVSVHLGNLAFSLSLFFIGCSTTSGGVWIFIGKLIKNEDLLSLTRFHSAEHAAVNAFYDLHRVPTLEEIKQYSNFSYGCGSLELLKRSSGIFAVAIARLFPGIWYIVAALVIIPVIIFLFSTERLYFLEALVTSEPTDKEYKVAIVALEDVLEKSKMVEISKGDSFGEMIITAFYAMLKDEFSEEKCKDCPKYEICKKKSQKK